MRSCCCVPAFVGDPFHVRVDPEIDVNIPRTDNQTSGLCSICDRALVHENSKHQTAEVVLSGTRVSDSRTSGPRNWFQDPSVSDSEPAVHQQCRAALTSALIAGPSRSGMNTDN